MKTKLLFAFLFFSFLKIQAQIGLEASVINTNFFEIDRYAYADIDGDGFEDIVILKNEEIRWSRFNNSYQIFESPILINSDTGYINANSIISDDIDNDGDNDIVVAFQNGLVIYRNSITGMTVAFSEELVSSSGSFENVNLADLDNDGDLDVVFSDQSHSIKWSENINSLGNFSSSFNPITGLSSSYPIVSIQIADIDSDTDLDLVYLHNGKIRWVVNQGTGNFSLADQIVSTVNRSYDAFEISDLDYDGDLDVIAVQHNMMVWFENSDSLGDFFGNENILSTIWRYSTNVKVVDVDNDGYRDLLIDSREEDEDRKIIYFKGYNNNGGFLSNPLEIADIYSTNAYDGDFIVSDIEGDGDLDIVFRSLESAYQLQAMFNTGVQGAYLEPINVNITIDANRVLIHDIDNDGDNDLIVQSGEISYLENVDGDCKYFLERNIYNESLYNSSLSIGDLDNDSELDIFYTDLIDGDIYWIERINDQEGFSEPLNIINHENVRGIIIEDVDNDGLDDIIGFSDRVFWYKNLDGIGNFGPENIITTEANFVRDIKLKDIDGDGFFDVISASFTDDKIAWYKNLSGQGEFGTQQIICNNCDKANSVFSEDVDNDGDYDIISTDEDGVNLFRNTDGLGNFGNQELIYDSNFYDFEGAISLGDFDSDGNIDLLLQNYDWLRLYDNVNGSGDFNSYYLIDDNSVEGDYVKITVSDINNNGNLDIIYISSNPDELGWFRNLGVLGNQINGIVQNDIDSNGCSNADNGTTNLIVSSDNGNDIFSVLTNQNGLYQNSVNEGNFVTQIQNLPSYYTSSPTSQVSNFVGIGNTATIDFCIEPTGVFNDLNISIYPSINDPRPGFDTIYQIVYTNVGTTQLSGSVSFEYDNSKLNFLSASETIASQTANTLTFDFTDLNPFETRTIDLEFNVFAPPTTNIDDILISTATINPVSNDETEEDNTFTLEQTVIGSYDPNDITVLEGDEITIDDADKYLHYLIRFQNTGTASAINVSVEHILDDKLDFTTMQLESLSHTGRVEIENETDVSFIFNNINLPDSTNDESNSHGFIAFKIKPKSNVQVGDIISGVADIYFDFNPPITTNTVNTEIVEPLSVGEEELQNVKLFPNPAQNKLQITSNQIIDGLTIVDINGRVLNSIEISVSDYSLDVSSLSKGVYFLEIHSGESKSTKKFIKN